jgi:hypothetical protein
VVDRRSGGKPQQEAPAPRRARRRAQSRARARRFRRPSISRLRASLATSALYHRASSAIPRATTAGAGSLLARQTIDTLEMLHLKTLGNLDSEEGRLLEGVLYELHLRYVEISK